MTTGPEPRFQPRGIYIPIDVIQMVETGVISSLHALLFGYIDSMVNWNGTGCWASNARLAKLIGCSARRIQGLLADGKRLGLVVDLGVQRVKHRGIVVERRILETKWSRVRRNADSYTVNGVGFAHEGYVMGDVGGTSPMTYNNKYKVNNKPSRNGCAVGEEVLGDEEMKGFFQEYEGFKESNISQLDYQWATHLKERLAKKLKVKRPVKVRSWAGHFTLLRLVDAIPNEEIDETLHWYCQNIGGQYTPRAYCAKSFRLKFVQIQEAMARAARKAKRELPPATQVSPEAMKIVDELRMKGWPKGSTTQLPGAVQKSLDNYTKFYKRVAGFWDTIQVSSRLRFFAQHLAEGGMPHPQNMILQWFTQVHKNVASWEAWSGNMESQVLAVKTEKFMATGRHWATRFAADATLFDKLLEELYARPTA